MCDQQRLRSACAYAQSDQSLCLSLEYSMTLMLLIEHHLEFLSLKVGFTGSYEPTLVKMPHNSFIRPQGTLFTCNTNSNCGAITDHLVENAYQKLFFLFLNQNICCGYSKEVSQWDSSFEYRKDIYVRIDGQLLSGKKIFKMLCSKSLFILTYELY